VPSGLKARFVSRDPAVVADYLGDPLNHGLVTPRLAQFVVSAGPKSIAAAADFQVPTLVLIGTADRLVDLPSARMFHDHLPARVRTLRVYAGYYHELFNEPPVDRARVLADLNDWLIRVSSSGSAG
jgi:alpha-beta hydrolase superfamily lysophospholipase